MLIEFKRNPALILRQESFWAKGIITRETYDHFVEIIPVSTMDEISRNYIQIPVEDIPELIEELKRYVR